MIYRQVVIECVVGKETSFKRRIEEREYISAVRRRQCERLVDRFYCSVGYGFAGFEKNMVAWCSLNHKDRTKRSRACANWNVATIHSFVQDSNGNVKVCFGFFDIC